jgi:hypothetical protein
VYKWKDEKSFPPFSEFVSYLVREVDIACRLNNRPQLKKEDVTERHKSKGFLKSRSLRTQVHEDNKGNTVATPAFVVWS